MSSSGFNTLKQDLPAGLIVFFVALPLNLGIAQASGTPLLSGVVAGIVGGLFVSFASGSRLSVTGPAAGLIILVLTALETLTFAEFLCAVMLAGVFQLGLGLARAGFIALFFPSSVIRGMLAAIGLVIIWKQIPHLLGDDEDFFGEMQFFQPDSRTTFSEIWYALGHAEKGPILAGAIALVVLIVWELPALKKFMFFQLFSGPLAAVITGLGCAYLLEGGTFEIIPAHKVALPVFDTFSQLQDGMTYPDWSALLKPQVYFAAAGLGLVASIETLLSLEAVDKLDPEGGTSPKNRELLAQGGGNILSGLFGGLPLSAVILRSSANVNGGGKTRMSSFIHGLCLVAALLFGARLINQIPNATLAAILLVTGYKLSHPRLYKLQFRLGYAQFLPFLVTILAVLYTDLLNGIAIGLAVGFFFILRAHVRLPIHQHKAKKAEQQPAEVRLELSEVVSFLNKAHVLERLHQTPNGGKLVVDARKARYIDFDVLEVIYGFLPEAKSRNIEVDLLNLPEQGRPRGIGEPAQHLN